MDEVNLVLLLGHVGQDDDVRAAERLAGPCVGADDEVVLARPRDDLLGGLGVLPRAVLPDAVATLCAGQAEVLVLMSPTLN